MNVTKDIERILWESLTPEDSTKAVCNLVADEIEAMLGDNCDDTTKLNAVASLAEELKLCATLRSNQNIP